MRTPLYDANARRKNFPVPVCAFHATDIETQREQNSQMQPPILPRPELP